MKYCKGQVEVERRRFLRLIGCAASIAVPTDRALAQRRMPVIGYLSSVARNDEWIGAFFRGLSDEGQKIDETARIEFRFADGNYDRLPSLAADLYRNPCDVIVALPSSPAALAAKSSAPGTPIVFFIGADPVKIGLVENINRPGGNLTGVVALSDILTPKRIEMLDQLLPPDMPIAELVNPANVFIERELRASKEAVDRTGRRFVELRASNRAEIEAAFATFEERRAGLVVWAESFFTSERELIVDLAARYSVITIYGHRLYTAAGGLVSYGPSTNEMHRFVGRYTGLVLKGARPGDLPIHQPTHLELVVNLRAARAVGLKIPDALLARADEVID